MKMEILRKKRMKRVFIKHYIRTRRVEEKPFHYFVQDLSVAEDGSLSTDGCEETVVVVVLGVVTVALGLAVTVAFVVLATVTVVKVVAVVRMRVGPPAALGPARTANETGCPLCRAADTCDNKAFC